MKRTIFCITCMLVGITLGFSTQVRAADLTNKSVKQDKFLTDHSEFGIGLQGATSAFGGLSFRYTGLAPIYLQTVGRFILNDQNSDHMLGGGVSYAIFEHHGRWHTSRLYFTLEGGWRYKKEPDLRDEIVKSTTLGGGLAFGGELVFSLGGIPLGLNVAVGQGFGREKTDSQSKGLAGVYVGCGIHAYF